jgi:GT2 family glycosyltransferase
MEIGIIITVFNCVQYTVHCINSIKSEHPFHLILIDDYSTDDTKNFFARLKYDFDHGELQSDQPVKDIVVVTDPETDSLAEKWNIGMQICEDRGLVAGLICNNDILFSEYTVNAVVGRLQKALDKDENIAMVTASNRRDEMDPEDILTIPDPGKGSEADSPDFSCFLMRVDAWNEMGKFDTNYIPCYFEDNDTHLALAKIGYRCLNVTSAPYYHYGSITQNSVPGGLCKPPSFEENRAYFEKKWGMSSTSDEYKKIIKNARRK